MIMLDSMLTNQIIIIKKAAIKVKSVVAEHRHMLTDDKPILEVNFSIYTLHDIALF